MTVAGKGGRPSYAQQRAKKGRGLHGNQLRMAQRAQIGWDRIGGGKKKGKGITLRNVTDAVGKLVPGYSIFKKIWGGGKKKRGRGRADDYQDALSYLEEKKKSSEPPKPKPTIAEKAKKTLKDTAWHAVKAGVKHAQKHKTVSNWATKHGHHKTAAVARLFGFGKKGGSRGVAYTDGITPKSFLNKKHGTPSRLTQRSYDPLTVTSKTSPYSQLKGGCMMMPRDRMPGVVTHGYRSGGHAGGAYLTSGLGKKKQRGGSRIDPPAVVSGAALI